MVFGIYCRKSVLSGKGESVANQAEMCRNYIFSKFGEGHEIRVYEDDGFSGRNTKRPMFEKMLSDVKTKNIDCIVCYRLDRMSRSVSDFSAVVDMLNHYGTQLICIKEEFDTSRPMGKAMMYIASVFAQFERETIGERVRDNMLMLARDGRWLGGNTPYGYKSKNEEYKDENGRTKNRCFLTENENFENAKTIFELFLKYGSVKRTAEELERLGIRSKNGKAFSNQALRDILRNPVYCKADEEAFLYFAKKGTEVCGSKCEYGLVSYNKGKNAVIASGRHKPILSGKQWTEVQKLVQRNARGISKGKALASGIIICGKCGGRMYAVTRADKVNFDYICENKRKNKSCDCKNLNGVKADKIFFEKAENTEKDLVKSELLTKWEIVWDGEKLNTEKRM